MFLIWPFKTIMTGVMTALLPTDLKRDFHSTCDKYWLILYCKLISVADNQFPHKVLDKLKN